MNNRSHSRFHRPVINLRTTALVTSMLVVFASACSPDGVEITAYPMLCETPVLSRTCSAKAISLNRETFRVFAASQQVVSWVPGIRETPVSLEKCSVRDSRNWKCQLPRDQGDVSFSDGEFTEALKTHRPDQEKFFYVSSVKWWWNRLVASQF